MRLGVYIEDPPGTLREIPILEYGERIARREECIVARDELADGRVLVSTTWIGLDHQFGEGPPLIYETMIFYEGYDGGLWQTRHTYRADALAGHAEALAWARDKVATAERALALATDITQAKEEEHHGEEHKP
jgi:hypothetical protein